MSYAHLVSLIRCAIIDSYASPYPHPPNGLALRGLIMLGIGGVSGHYLYPRTIEVETGRIIERTLPPSEEDILRVCKDLQGK
jgi:hypothetical protein